MKSKGSSLPENKLAFDVPAGANCAHSRQCLLFYQTSCILEIVLLEVFVCPVSLINSARSIFHGR